MKNILGKKVMFFVDLSIFYQSKNKDSVETNDSQNWVVCQD